LASRAGAQTSELWGASGELWSASGRLPDFSHAGYHEGEVAVPEVPVVANALDFGAKGDGSVDDAPAIQAAIDSATAGAILLPKGRYRIDSVLVISKSGVVLRGEGAGATGSILVADKSLADVFGADPKWSYSGGFVQLGSTGSPSLLAGVASSASGGALDLDLAGAPAIAAGELVELRLVDDGSGSLGRHLHGELADSGTCAYQVPLRFDWPVRVEAAGGGHVTLRQPLRTDVRPEWTPELWSFPAISEVGVEHLRIEFPDVPYAGHLQEPGYNAIFMQNGVVDAWVKDVTVVNADDAFLTEVRVKNVSFLDVRTEGRLGHHGFNLNQSADVLIDGFDMQSDWWHTVTVDHRTNGTVVTRGQSASPMSLDHHRDSPFENLFTEVGPYGFQSGGSTCAGPQAGARNTYWNLAAPMIAPLLWSEMQTNVVGDLSDEIDPTKTPDRQWLEALPVPDPPNLWEAQLAARMCPVPANPCARAVWTASLSTCGEVLRPDGAVCDDDDASTTNDACQAGVCRGIRDIGRDDTGGCGCRSTPSGSSGPASFGWLILGLLALSRVRSPAPERS
jgi:MYXO-CTERM domain-containing protein